ncbi:MAG: class IV adenylate cyclase [Methanomicrobiales archaeon]|nr:class IV adenylate cyclase [Methanomicrobiales archaeon]
MMEVEMKIPVPDLQDVRNRLIGLGFRHMEMRDERDVYYNAVDRDFGKTDEALRVRVAGSECTLTYKGPRLRMHGLKAREELTVHLDSISAMEEILERLGLTRVMEVRKRREVFRSGEVTVALDEVEGLGSYVEIEMVVSDEVEKAKNILGETRNLLGIDGEPVNLSYLEMLLVKRSAVRS